MISIVITTWNGLRETKTLVESLLLNVVDDFEIVFSDNDSKDGTIKFIKDLQKNVSNHTHLKQVKLVQLKNAGFSKAVNKGIEVTESNTPIIMNNDTLVTKNTMWYNDLIEAVKRGFTLSCSTTNVCGYPLQYFHNRECVKPASLIVPECNFICICLSKSFWNEHKLDENYISGVEDIDYCWTIRKNGGKILIPLSSFVYHKGSVTNKREFKEKGMKSNLSKGWKYFANKWKDDGGLERAKQYFGDDFEL